MENDLKKEGKNKRRKYRLLILLLLLVSTGVLLTTSTYAWFTSNKTVSVSSLEVQIEARNGIQISVDGSNWKSIVQRSDLETAIATYAAAKNQLPTVLEPVSTGGTPDTDGLFPMYYGTVVSSTSADNEGSYILTATKETEANGSTGRFIAYDLFFKVEKDTEIWLTNSSKITSTDPDNDTGIKNASRVGFIVKGNIADGSALADIQALNLGTASTPYIWELNYDTHTASGIANARDVYGKETEATNGTRIAYSGITDEITADEDILLGKATATDNATKFQDVTVNYQTKYGYTHYVPIFSLTKGITKVRIYMWVEGQDVDCENNASNGKITFDLQITSELPEGQATTEG